MALKKILFVKKGKYFSFHSSFKTACKVYGWDHKKLTLKHNGVPHDVDGCLLQRIPMEVSMYSLAVLSVVLAPDSESCHKSDTDYNDGWVKKTFTTDEGEVNMKVNFDIARLEGTTGESLTEHTNHSIVECVFSSEGIEDIDVDLCEYTQEFLLTNIDWSI